jgi:hypothetical protein
MGTLCLERWGKPPFPSLFPLLGVGSGGSCAWFCLFSSRFLLSLMRAIAFGGWVVAGAGQSVSQLWYK